MVACLRILKVFHGIGRRAHVLSMEDRFSYGTTVFGSPDSSREASSFGEIRSLSVSFLLGKKH